MHNKIIISEATIENIPDVLKLYSQADIDNDDILTVDEAQGIFEKFNRYPKYSLYVAKIDNAIIGTFELLIMDNLAHKGKPSAIMEDVIVDMNYRSQGIGKKMVEFAMEISRKNGCYKLSLSSNLKRERAHKFYEKLGFIKHGFSYVVVL